MFSFFQRKQDETSKPDDTNHTMSNNNNNKVVCVDCDKKTQQEAPSNSIATEQCAQDYIKVAACMSKNKDQVTACVQEWNIFKQCHEANRPKHNYNYNKKY